MLINRKDIFKEAWLIKENNNLTLEQKHAGWRELIANSEDQPFDSNGMYDEGNVESFHKFLSEYIEFENSLLERFFNEEHNAVYTYKCWCEDECEWLGEDGPLYADFDGALREFKDDLEFEPEFGIISKRYIGPNDERIHVRLRPEDFAVMRLAEDWIVDNDKDYKLCYSVWWALFLIYGSDDE